ncbi:hypothetical protein D1AOALGA4SA_3358 [Olavius algarvensis Delta 1 endosymbiont]|nr:hypothetical protein D1AOALGA4SA_3358 [Olavius algarvensis Delta 1 endosymbiont]
MLRVVPVVIYCVFCSSPLKGSFVLQFRSINPSNILKLDII